MFVIAIGINLCLLLMPDRLRCRANAVKLLRFDINFHLLFCFFAFSLTLLQKQTKQQRKSGHSTSEVWEAKDCNLVQRNGALLKKDHLNKSLT